MLKPEAALLYSHNTNATQSSYAVWTLPSRFSCNADTQLGARRRSCRFVQYIPHPLKGGPTHIRHETLVLMQEIKQHGTPMT